MTLLFKLRISSTIISVNLYIIVSHLISFATKQSPGLFLPNLLLASFAKFGVSCHRFEPYTYLHKNKKDTEWYPFYFGGNNRARTCDPLLVRQMLSQLSYAPVSDIDYITSCVECQEFILEKSSFILSISLFKYK